MKKFFKAIGVSTLYLLFFFALQMAVQIAVLTVYSLVELFPYLLTHTFPSITSIMNAAAETYTSHVYIITGFADLIALVLFALFFHIQKKNFFTENRILPIRPLALPWVFLIGVSFNIIVTRVLAWMPFPETWQQTNISVKGVMMQEHFTLILLTIILIGPVFEEIFFRGLVYRSLRGGMPELLVIIISSLVFGLWHGNIIQFLYTTVVGILFCLLNLRTGSLLSGIIAHIAFNSASMVSALIYHFFPEISLAFFAGGIIVFLISFVMLFLSTKVSQKFSGYNIS